ncbi:MAG: sigma-70 family RNA polymerase sigma factor, partial [Bacteroidota bacterium]
VVVKIVQVISAPVSDVNVASVIAARKNKNSTTRYKCLNCFNHQAVSDCLMISNDGYMNVDQIWNEYKEEVYFFILKRLKDKDAADEILQNSFLKVCLYLDALKDQKKLKAWIFQITRNEIINHINQASKQSKVQELDLDVPECEDTYEDICCLERFVKELPDTYKKTIELLYFQGKKQHEVAEILGISLANVKARTRRGKSIMKKNLQICCQYEVNKGGDLVGEPNCARCE